MDGCPLTLNPGHSLEEITMKEGRIITAICIAAVGLVIFFASTADAAGFREQESWKFRTPMERSVQLQVEQHRQLYNGRYFKGSHAAKYQNIDVHIDNVDADGMQYQEITNIGNSNQTVNEITGDGNMINVDGTQDSADQNGQNGATWGDGSNTSQQQDSMGATLNVE